MAITNEESTQVANKSATPPVLNDVCDDRARMRCKRFGFTQGAAAGDAGSTAVLINIPPGKLNIHAALSRIAFSAFGAARTLSIGHSGYTKPDGTVVAAAPGALKAGLDVAAAGSADMTGVVGGDETLQIDSKTGTTILATVAGGTIPVAAKLDGQVYFSHD